MKFLTIRFLVLVFCALFLSFSVARGQEPSSKETKQIRLISGRSQIVDLPFSVKRVSVGDPLVADVLVLSPRQIYLLGKGTGGTNLLIQGDERQMILDLVVGADLSLLKERFNTLLPGERIEVYQSKEWILLKGEVSSSPTLMTALSIAEPFAPGKVMNLLQVGGLQQVLLEVKIAEVSRTALNRLGVNLASVVKDSFFGFTNLGGSVPIEKFALGLPSLNLLSVEQSIGANNNLFFGAPRGHIFGFLDALKQNGLGKILAEPSLMAISGQEASFLAGGEFPIPVPGSATSGITIDYKKFGVQLRFTPTVLDAQKISLKVAPEVSELDFSAAVQVGGFVVPSLTSRSASTTVELIDGHTLAIAGLIREDSKNLISKFPILGDIPILGMLFRSTSFQKNETELIILVTPRLVKSVGASETVTLPTDRFSDYEHELMGYWTRRKETPPADPLPGGMEGELGHSN